MNSSIYRYRPASCLASGLLAASLVSNASHAQQNEPVQRVEITGSSIKRIAREGALPVQQLSQEAIARSGATTVADLIQKLPAMQGFVPVTTAVGTNSGGRVSASIHNIGEEYTLVLLNGRRLAPQGSGSAVNLNAIPMSAVEKVEILTDGASALYGSDAIAGVVNFILKRQQQGGEAEFSYANPLEGGAKSGNASLTYGFGDLSEDAYNLLLSYRHDEQAKLSSTEREFSKTAFLPFTHNGQQYVFDRTSNYSVPANVTVRFNNPALATLLFNPYLKKTGECGPLQVPNLNTAGACAFDYASTLETIPESRRDSLFATGRYRLTGNWTWFSDMAFSRYDLTARIAPNPVPVTISSNSAYFNNSVLPYLTPQQAASVRSVTASYRMLDWGQRASNTITDSSHLVTGLEGEFGGWSVNTALTYSRNAIDERYTGGYVNNQAFRTMLAAVAFDPMLPAGQQSEATRQQIHNSLFNGSIRTASTTLQGIDARASRELFDLAGGRSSIGIGADLRQYSYLQDPSAPVAAGQVYNLDVPPSYSLARRVFGLFGEIQLPLSQDFEINGSLRHDRYTAVDDRLSQSKVGEGSNATTYKLSLRYQPSRDLLLRASYGTGFKLANMLSIAQPLVSAGFTNNWNCPFPGSEYCRPGQSQYARLTGGNSSLKPEKSTQYSIGFRYEPSPDWGVGMDLWNVEMRDQISSVSQQLAFNDPQKYASLFTLAQEMATGNSYWAFKDLSLNIGRSKTRGIDWDMMARRKIAGAILSANLNGTYLLKSEATNPGTDNVWDSDLGRFGIYNSVGFRHILSAAVSLEIGKLSNTLTMRYRSGYQDAEAIVRNLGNGQDERLRLQLASSVIFDWQGKYSVSRQLEIRAGIKNLFNQAPRRSLQSAGGGHHTGFDARYSDVLMRTLYLSGKYQF